MIIAVYLSVYTGLLIFLGASAWRAYRYARLPVHLRWELYPIPHEDPRRARYGGSYFEEQNWFAKPQRRHHFGEVRAMGEEILLFKSLRTFNRRLWLPSFLFHFGIYLSIAAVVLAAAAGLLTGAIDTNMGGAFDTFAKSPAALGLAGAILILAGAGLLLARRLIDPALRNSTRPGDIFNLLFFLITFALLAGGYQLRGPGSASLAEFARGALHFDRGVKISGAFAAGLLLASALAAYIPFTHMAHFVAKYFTWHSVRWDDRRSEAGGTIENKVTAYLASAPTWSAAHVGADGEKTWAEIATGPAQETRR